jgi:hypothetical protein
LPTNPTPPHPPPALPGRGLGRASWPGVAAAQADSDPPGQAVEISSPDPGRRSGRSLGGTAARSSDLNGPAGLGPAGSPRQNSNGHSHARPVERPRKVEFEWTQTRTGIGVPTIRPFLNRGPRECGWVFLMCVCVRERGVSVNRGLVRPREFGGKTRKCMFYHLRTGVRLLVLTLFGL